MTRDGARERPKAGPEPASQGKKELLRAFEGLGLGFLKAFESVGFSFFFFFFLGGGGAFPSADVLRGASGFWGLGRGFWGVGV